MRKSVAPDQIARATQLTAEGDQFFKVTNCDLKDQP